MERRRPFGLWRLPRGGGRGLDRLERLFELVQGGVGEGVDAVRIAPVDERRAPQAFGEGPGFTNGEAEGDPVPGGGGVIAGSDLRAALPCWNSSPCGSSLLHAGGTGGD